MTEHEKAQRPEDLTRLFVDRANAKDAAGIAALYEEHAVMAYPPGSRTVGRTAIRELWEKLLPAMPRFAAEDPLPALISDDIATRLQAAKAWSLWEAVTSTLRASPEMQVSMSKDDFALAFARLVTHYVAHDFFLEDGIVLRNAHLLEDVPGVLVHGRHDLCHWREMRRRLLPRSDDPAGKAARVHDLRFGLVRAAATGVRTCNQLPCRSKLWLRAGWLRRADRLRPMQSG